MAPIRNEIAKPPQGEIGKETNLETYRKTRSKIMGRPSDVASTQEQEVCDAETGRAFILKKGIASTPAGENLTLAELAVALFFLEEAQSGIPLQIKNGIRVIGFLIREMANLETTPDLISRSIKEANKDVSQSIASVIDEKMETLLARVIKEASKDVLQTIEVMVDGKVGTLEDKIEEGLVLATEVQNEALSLLKDEIESIKTNMEKGLTDTTKSSEEAIITVVGEKVELLRTKLEEGLTGTAKSNKEALVALIEEKVKLLESKLEDGFSSTTKNYKETFEKTTPPSNLPNRPLVNLDPAIPGPYQLEPEWTPERKLGSKTNNEGY